MLYKVKDLHQTARVIVVNEIENYNYIHALNRLGKTHLDSQPHGMQ